MDHQSVIDVIVNNRDRQRERVAGRAVRKSVYPCFPPSRSLFGRLSIIEEQFNGPLKRLLRAE